MITPSHSKKAFTLVELVVVLSIISIATGITLVSFSSQRVPRSLERASREVVAALREAQGYALSGRSSSGEDNCWIGLDSATGAAAYTLMNNYRTGATCATSANGTVASYSLKENVVFTGTERISFRLPRGEVLYLNGGAMSVLGPGGSRIIGLTKGGSTRYICVYSTGRIIENGSSSTCP